MVPSPVVPRPDEHSLPELDAGICLRQIFRVDRWCGIRHGELVSTRLCQCLEVHWFRVLDHTSKGSDMPSSEYLRQKIAELAKKRADLEKGLAAAHQTKTRKESEAAARASSAHRASSASSQRTYVRQAEAAQRAALAEGKKVADLSGKLADLAKQEGQRNRELAAAIRSESAAQARAEAKNRKDREAAEKRRASETRAAELRRQQERLADEQRRRNDALRHELNRLADQESAVALVAATEERLSQQIDAIRPPKREQLRILYVTAAARGDLRVDEEIRRVKAAVRAATHRDQVLIEHLPAATPSDFLDGLTRLRPLLWPC